MYCFSSFDIQDKLEACFIPAGFDTVDLIKISTAVKHNAEEVQHKLKSDMAARKVRCVVSQIVFICLSLFILCMGKIWLYSHKFQF